MTTPSPTPPPSHIHPFQEAYVEEDRRAREVLDRAIAATAPATAPLFSPTFDRLTVEPLPFAERRRGGIIQPVVAARSYALGRVLSVGDGILLDNGSFEAIPYSPNDVIAYDPAHALVLDLGVAQVTVLSLAYCYGRVRADLVAGLVAAPAAPAADDDSEDDDDDEDEEDEEDDEDDDENDEG